MWLNTTAFYSVLSILQTVIAIWQFFRVAKILKMPYALLSSFWNTGILSSIPMWRDFITMDNDDVMSSFNHCRNMLNDIEGWEEAVVQKYNFDATTNMGDYNKVCCFLYQGKERKVILSTWEAKILMYLLYRDGMQIASYFTPITYSFVYVKGIDFDQALKLLCSRKYPVERDGWCIVDHSSEEYINQDFFRFMSIFPLALQARGFQLSSAILTLLLVLLDIISFPANKAWKWFKVVFADCVKLSISRMPDYLRLTIHHNLGSASKLFMYCDTGRQKCYFKSFNLILCKGHHEHNDCEFIEPDDNEGFFLNQTMEFKINEIEYCLGTDYDEEEEEDDTIMYNLYCSERGYSTYGGTDKKSLKRVYDILRMAEQDRLVLCDYYTGSRIHMSDPCSFLAPK